MCHLSGSNHPSSPTCPAPLTYLSPLLRVSSSFLCLLSSTVPLSSCISVLFLFLALFFPLFWFLFHLNLLYIISFIFSLPPSQPPLSSPGMCHLSGSNHPSSPTCPTPLIYPSPLLRVSSSFLCRLSSTVPLSSCISVLFLFLALCFPLFWFLFHLNLLYLLSFVFSLPP